MTSNSKIIFSVGKIIVTLVMLFIVIVGGTFAWFSYRSKESALVLSIGDINDSKIVINPYEIRESLIPVNIYTSGVYSQVEVINNSGNFMDFKLFYRINNLDEEIIDSGLKYTIVSSDTIDGVYEEVKTGDFLSIEDMNEYVIYKDAIPSNTILYYKVYVWLDSSVGNQSVINNAALDIELNAKGMIFKASPVESYSCANGSLGSEPYVFTYTGNCTVVDDGNGDWRVKFLTSGTFQSGFDMAIDAFLVGGGGGGSCGAWEGGGYDGRSGGGGGYTTTVKSVSINSNIGYEIIVGDGGAGGDVNSPAGKQGGTSSAFGTSVLGGYGGGNYSGGAGGSGGGSGNWDGSGYNSNLPGSGGSDGSNGGNAFGSGGRGQTLTTREFGEADGTLYAGGGGGASSVGLGSGGSGGGGGGEKNGTKNTGGGGGGSSASNSSSARGANGGSGIVIIRNTKTPVSDNKVPIFTYTGTYEIVDDNDNYINATDGDWKIRFLTSGTLTFTELNGAANGIDVFLVGGGGGGSARNWAGTSDGRSGGGGGYTTTATNVIVEANDVTYSIVVGDGGAAGATVNGGYGGTGGQSSAFNFVANGGSGGGNYVGGAGGSGGGSGNWDGSGINSGVAGSGGTDGSNGGAGLSSGGAGQGSTTREFGDPNGKLYAGGGGGASGAGYGAGGSGGGGGGGKNGKKNTGGGGGGTDADASSSTSAGSGGSGIVIIRNKR